MKNKKTITLARVISGDNVQPRLWISTTVRLTNLSHPHQLQIMQSSSSCALWLLFVVIVIIAVHCHGSRGYPFSTAAAVVNRNGVPSERYAPPLTGPASCLSYPFPHAVTRIFVVEPDVRGDPVDPDSPQSSPLANNVVRRSPSSSWSIDKEYSRQVIMTSSRLH